ncbi:hypothetical protein [Mesobacillus foraminis]|uniref:hypothetical protein n=1 Tax=Mesobacillus foraminis TaxID=279826 RepID=UPI000EF4CEB2|nr:hypothetical protein [Mesobacillus foraminis]
MDIHEVINKFEDAFEDGVSEELHSFIDTLNIKIFRVNYFIDQFLVEKSNYENETDSNKLNDATWINESFEKIGANAASALYHLHSLADVLGQVINETVLNRHFTDIGDVSITSIANALKQKVNGGDVSLQAVFTKVRNLTSSQSWYYTNAFVNSEKHRLLIQYSDQRNLGQRNMVPTFNEFNFKNRNYPQTQIEPKLDQCKSKIIDDLNRVLDEIFTIYGV